VLKNAIDYIYPEWADKPVGFQYGNAGGRAPSSSFARVVVELQMTPIRSAIHLPVAVYLAVMHEPVPAESRSVPALEEGRVNHVERFFHELLWSARALKSARAAHQRPQPAPS
jgi:NAD(P)H-dependent FMN reductase